MTAWDLLFDGFQLMGPHVLTDLTSVFLCKLLRWVFIT